MTPRRAAVIWLGCAIAPWAVVLLVNMTGPSLDREATVHERDRCSWACYNNSCVHEESVPWLPALLTSNKGWFGSAIDMLHSTGSYRAANLVVFCLLWPGWMWFMVGYGLLQRIRIHRLRTWERLSQSPGAIGGDAP